MEIGQLGMLIINVNNMTKEDLKIIEAMYKYGGGFVKALAECFLKADAENFIILKAVFSKYWTEYREMVKE